MKKSKLFRLKIVFLNLYFLNDLKTEIMKSLIVPYKVYIFLS